MIRLEYKNIKQYTIQQTHRKMQIETARSYLKFVDFSNKELLDQCVKDTESNLDEYPPIKIFNRICHQRRCVGFFSDESIGYRYSNQISRSKPMTPALIELLELVNSIFNTEYNECDENEIGIWNNNIWTGELDEQYSYNQVVKLENEFASISIKQNAIETTSCIDPVVTIKSDELLVSVTTLNRVTPPRAIYKRKVTLDFS